jgi:uncharacterized protein with gpF-like domain
MLRQAFARYVADVRSPEELSRISAFLERGDIQGAIKDIEAHVLPLGRTLSRVFSEVAQTEVGNLVKQLGGLSRVSLVFDPTNTRATQLMQNASLDFIKGFAQAQQESVRQAVSRSFSTGDSIDAAARSFRNALGLTAKQEQAVENYRVALENNRRDALTRALRDRRFDSTVEDAVDTGAPLSEQQIARMTDRYRERMVAYRGDTIARTEALSTVNEAKHEAMLQAVEQADLDTERLIRVWHSTRDKRTRDTHREMNGQEVGIDEPFESPSGAQLMYPGDDSLGAGPEEIISCRCVVTYRIK